MNFSSNINLTHLSSIAVLSSLWKKEIIADINCLLEINQFEERWPDIESNVMSLVRKLFLPIELKSDLESLVEPMGNQLDKWISLIQPLFETFHYVPATIRFFWTGRGTLDSVKTASYIIDHCLPKELRFCLACIFCIEETIHELWPQVCQTISEKVKMYPSAIDSTAVLYWVYFLSGDVETLMDSTDYCDFENVYEFALWFLSDVKCTSTLRYFLDRLEPERKKMAVHAALQSILRSLHHEGNILVFLFSYLEESDISQIISENTLRVLVLLLEWPCQEFFMSVAHSYWSCLSSSDYLELLEDVLEIVSLFKGSIYKNIAKEFWKSSPPPHKEYVISNCTSGRFLCHFFLNPNAYEIIPMFFRDCSQNQRLQMIYNFRDVSICDVLVERERWDFLKLFVTSCIPNREVLEEFISKYTTSKPFHDTDGRELRTPVLIEKIREWY